MVGNQYEAKAARRIGDGSIINIAEMKLMAPAIDIMLFIKV